MYFKEVPDFSTYFYRIKRIPSYLLNKVLIKVVEVIERELAETERRKLTFDGTRGRRYFSEVICEKAYTDKRVLSRELVKILWSHKIEQSIGNIKNAFGSYIGVRREDIAEKMVIKE